MRSLRPRFLLVSGITIAGALLATAFVFVYLFEQNMEQRVDSELTNLMNQIAAGLEYTNDGSIKAPAQLLDQRLQNAYGGLYWQIMDEQTGATLRSRSLWDYVLPLPNDIHDAGSFHRYVLPGPGQGDVYVQERSLVVATPVGTRTIRIAAAIDQRELESAKQQFAVDTIPYLVVLGLLLLAASALQLAIGLKPLTAISRDLDAIRDRKHRRLQGHYPEEIRRLVDALNQLLDSQEHTLNRARARSADLAHGLKTPLTILRNHARTLIQRGESVLGSEIGEMVQVMEAHVSYELARSRMAPAPEHRKADAIPLDIVLSLVKTLQRTPKGEHIDWQTDVPGDKSVEVDPDDLRELLGNLLENASKWARSKVTVVGRVKTDRLVLSIEDDGPGIDTAKIAEMADRGKRFDQTVPGSGIGLAIVRDIADIYRLPYRIQNRQDSGLSITIELPLGALAVAGEYPEAS